MAIPADITDLDAHGASDRTSGTVKLNVYETLVAPDENMDLQPLLAESYEQLDDHTWELYWNKTSPSMTVKRLMQKR